MLLFILLLTLLQNSIPRTRYVPTARQPRPPTPPVLSAHHSVRLRLSTNTLRLSPSSPVFVVVCFRPSPPPLFPAIHETVSVEKTLRLFQNPFLRRTTIPVRNFLFCSSSLYIYGFLREIYL